MANEYLTIMKQMLESMNSANIRAKKVLTVTDVAKYTGFSVSQIYKLTSQRAIPHYRVHRRTLFFKKAEIDRWLTQNPVPEKDLLLESLLVELPNKKIKK